MRCEMKDRNFHLNYPIKRAVKDKICWFCGMVSGAFAFRNHDSPVVLGLIWRDGRVV